MENKSLDDIFSELAEKYSGSTNIKKEAADIKNNFMNVNKANISSHSVGNLQSPVNITGEKLPELFTGKNIILKINKESLDIKDIDFEIDKTKKYALVLGNEVEGISDEILTDLDVCLEIPQLGTKHSLNVSVCGGIVMWEFFKNLK